MIASENKDFEANTLHRAFHASFNSAYQSDTTKVEDELKKKFGVSEIAICKPFYKNYQGLLYGQYREPAGYVIQTANETIVAYRGTKTLYDMFRDLKASTVIMKCGGKKLAVHEGFKLDYDSSKESLYQTLRQIPSKPVIFTGHSLGGAVAQLAAIDYLETTNSTNETNSWSSKSLKAVYTFGSPRVFQQSAAPVYDELTSNKTLHIMVSGDPVTGLPPTVLGYVHTGRYISLKTDFKISTHFIDAYQQVIGRFVRRFNNNVNQSITKEDVTKQVGLSFSLASYLNGLPNPQKFWNQLISMAKKSILFDKLKDKEKNTDEVDNIELGNKHTLLQDKVDATISFRIQLNELKKTKKVQTHLPHQLPYLL